MTEALGVEKLAAARVVEMNPPLKKVGALLFRAALQLRHGRNLKERSGRRGVRDGRANERYVGALGQGAAPSVVVDRIYEVAKARIGGHLWIFVGWWLRPPRPRRESRTLFNPYSYQLISPRRQRYLSVWTALVIRIGFDANA